MFMEEIVEIKIDPIEDARIKVNAVIDAKTVDEKIKSVYRDFSKKYNFPGFRRGKAPRPVIDNAFGKSVIMAQVTEDLINDAFPKVIEEKRIFPVGSPDFGDPAMAEDGHDLAFEFEQAIKPTYELTDYEPVSVEVPEAAVSDAEIQEQLDALLDRYQNYEDAPKDAKIDDENCADLKIEATKEDGEDVVGLTSDSAFFAPDTSLYSKDFAKEIKGMKAGEKKEFSLDVAKDDSSVLMSDVAGQRIDFKVECEKVKTLVKPTLTDEWVKDTLGFDSVEDLKDNIKENMESQKQEVVPRIKENECAQKLIERLQGEVPDSMLEQTESELLQDFFTQLQSQGISFDSYLSMQGIDSDQFKEDVKLQAQDNAKRDLALDAWASHYDIEATDEDVTLEFERAGLEDPAQTEKEWREQGRLYLIREGIIRKKSMEDVLDKAKVKELSYEDFKKKMDSDDE